MSEADCVGRAAQQITLAQVAGYADLVMAFSDGRNFDSRNILTGGILLPRAAYRDPGQVIVFWSELRRRVAALPGVSAVAFSGSRPPDDAWNQNNFHLETAPDPPGHSQPVTTWER